MANGVLLYNAFMGLPCCSNCVINSLPNKPAPPVTKIIPPAPEGELLMFCKMYYLVIVVKAFARFLP